MRFLLSRVIIGSLPALLFRTCAVAEIESGPILIVWQEQDVSPSDNFSSRWEAGNGIVAEEEEKLKNAGQKDEAEVVRGSAAWTAPDGTTNNLGWTADENGAVFQGAHLPTSHPTPEIPILIKRALD